MFKQQQKLTVEVNYDMFLENLWRWLHNWTVKIIFWSSALGLTESSFIGGWLLFYWLIDNHFLFHFFCFSLRYLSDMIVYYWFVNACVELRFTDFLQLTIHIRFLSVQRTVFLVPILEGEFFKLTHGHKILRIEKLLLIVAI